MKNPYLQNLNKIEFIVTDACTGKCKHCSQGDHHGSGAHVDAHVAADAVRKIAAQAKACGLPVRLSPAWLVSPDHDNPYNRKAVTHVGAHSICARKHHIQPTI